MSMTSRRTALVAAAALAVVACGGSEGSTEGMEPSASPSTGVDPLALPDDQRVPFACEQTQLALDSLRRTELSVSERKRGALQGLQRARQAVGGGPPEAPFTAFLFALATATSQTSTAPDGDPDGLATVYAEFCPPA